MFIPAIYMNKLSKPLLYVYFRQIIASAVFGEGKSLRGECLNVLSYIEDSQESLKVSEYDVILKQTRNTL
jgi:hypothetical protein